MNLKINYNLWKAKSEISPDFGFKRDLLKKLSSQFSPVQSKIIWHHSSAARLATAAVIVVIVVGISSVSAYAYASDQVTPDNPLYSIKQNMEKIEEKIAVTPEAKAKVYLKKIQRREAEQKVLARKGKKDDRLEAAINKIEEKLEKTEKQLDAVSSTANKEIREKVKVRLQNRIIKYQNNIDKKVEKLNRLKHN